MSPRCLPQHFRTTHKHGSLRMGTASRKPSSSRKPAAKPRTIPRSSKRTTRPRSLPKIDPIIILRVHPTHRSDNGQWYRVDREDGSTLVARSRDPEHDAARALLGLNIAGTFQTIFGTNAHPSFAPRDIAVAALFSTRDEAKRGLVRRKWAPIDAET